MKRTKGFTLVELLVVVAIIALLVSILLPTLGKAKEMARAALCAANLNGVGKGIVLYQVENDDATPWLESDDWTSVTGTNADNTTQPDTLSPTALMFMVVRSGQPVGIFKCPSDGGASKMDTIRFDSGNDSYYYWDFCDTEDLDPGGGDCKKVSYSFQAPLYDGVQYYSAGFKTSSGSGLAVMADKTPEYDKSSDNDFLADTNWDVTSISDEDRMNGMSQNHSSGNAINVLYADAHVSAGENRADVGISKDNIYSASNDATEGTQGAGSLSLTEHLSTEDSFLIGPVKD